MPERHQTTFESDAESLLNPKLASLGFAKVRLEHCIGYAVLFRMERLWFGASWDARELQLDLHLGHLYWFTDVMPRVIILGDYGSYVPELESLAQDTNAYPRSALELVRDTISDALEVYGRRYDQLLEANKHPEKGKYTKDFLTHLGQEVSLHELQKFLR